MKRDEPNGERMDGVRFEQPQGICSGVWSLEREQWHEGVTKTLTGLIERGRGLKGFDLLDCERGR